MEGVEARQGQQEILPRGGEFLEEGILAKEAPVILAVPAIGPAAVDGDAGAFPQVEADMAAVRCQEVAGARCKAFRQLRRGRCGERLGKAAIPLRKAGQREPWFHGTAIACCSSAADTA